MDREICGNENGTGHKVMVLEVTAEASRAGGLASEAETVPLFRTRLKIRGLRTLAKPGKARRSVIETWENLWATRVNRYGRWKSAFLFSIYSWHLYTVIQQ